MARFFIFGANYPQGGTVILSGEDAEHARVLRLRVGEEIVISDGAGRDFNCTVRGFTGAGVEAEVNGIARNTAEPSVAVTVVAGLPKQAERAEYTVQKCTECGATKLLFYRSHRCVADPGQRSIEKKLARWQRIAEEAAKQSGRGMVPEVAYSSDFGAALEAGRKTALPLFLYETGERTPLREVLEAEAPGAGSAAILTGPEGGFEPYEAELARRLGFRVCAMGPRILRCETAPVAALAALMYATGNLS